MPKTEMGNQVVYCGARLFELKATYGLPLDVAVDRIMNQEGLKISWDQFITQARSQGWFDYQTLDVAEQALTDADVPRDLRDGILTRMKIYVIDNRYSWS